MLKKISKIFQFGGKGNISYIDNREYKYVVSTMYEQVEEMKMKGDYNGLAKYMIYLKRQFETSHPLYPSYRYNVQETPIGLFVQHEAMSSDAAERLPLQYNISFRFKGEKLPKYKSFRDLLKIAAIHQENIVVDVLSIQAMIAGNPIDTPFLQEHIKDAEWIIAPEKRPDPLILSMQVTTEGEKIETILPYIELGISDIEHETNNYVLDNSRQQGAKIYVKLSVPINPIYNERGYIILSSDLTLKINVEYERDVEANLRFASFFHNSANSTSVVTFLNLQTNSNFMVGNKMRMKNNIADLEGKINILQRLYLLEQFFNVKLQLPSYKFTNDDIKGLEILESIRTKKPITSKVDKITCEIEGREHIENFINSFKDNKALGLQLTFTNSDASSGIEVSGIFISLPFLERKVVHNALLLRDMNALREQLKSISDNEIIQFELIPTGDNTIREWYSYSS